MNTFTKAILAAALTASFGWAQESVSHGYVYQGFGTKLFDEGSAVGHTGAGVDIKVWKGLTAGGDIGAAYPLRYPRGVVGLANGNGSYHFRPSQKWQPFVTAGYSLFFRSGTANAFNYGGGVVYWFKPKIGLRAEVRDYRLENVSAMTEFRIGFTFR